MAHLTEEQLEKIHTEEKGDVLVNVEVSGVGGVGGLSEAVGWMMA